MTEPACPHRRFGEPCISCRTQPQRLVAKVIKMSCSECGSAHKVTIAGEDTLNVRHQCGYSPAWITRETSPDDGPEVQRG